MKTIGLLGGTGWASTILYYKQLNELVGEHLGGYHSAKILLKSIDYHDIMGFYNTDKVASILQNELSDLLACKPDCLIICCNSLHKYYDMIKDKLNISIPVFHAVELVRDAIIQKKFHTVLLLATTFTLNDGFFAKTLERRGIKVLTPNAQEREHMKKIHDELMQNHVTEISKKYVGDLIASYENAQVVVLGCTEYSMIVDATNSVLPMIDPVQLQTTQAVEWACAE